MDFARCFLLLLSLLLFYFEMQFACLFIVEDDK